MSFDFWTRWLLVVAIFLVIFGLALAFLNQSLFFEVLFNSNVDPVFWDTAFLPQAAREFQRWAYGVLGATVAGWGVCLAFLAHYPFRRKEVWAWNCMLAGILVWYLPDTILSMRSGVVFNAVFNTLLLILVCLPLAVTRRTFSRSAAPRRPRTARKGGA